MTDLGDDDVFDVDYEKRRLVTKFLEGHDLVHVDYDQHRVVVIDLDGDVLVNEDSEKHRPGRESLYSYYRL